MRRKNQKSFHSRILDLRNKYIASGLFLLSLFIAVNTLSQNAIAANGKQTNQNDSAADKTKTIFNIPFEDLRTGQLEFRGTEKSRKVIFSLPHGTTALPGSTVQIKISHSPGLLPHLSDLTIVLNDKVIKTISLDASNINAQNLSFPLTGVPLKDFNELVLTVRQHYTIECEDAFSSALWTVIDPDSKIIIACKSRAATGLENWPNAIFDQLTPGQTTVGLILPNSPSVQTANALSAVAHSIGAYADYRNIKFTNGLNGINSAMAVGTPDQNSWIAQNLSKMGVSIVDGKIVDFSGKVADENTGLLALTQQNGYPVLVISGNTPAGVQRAAHALANKNFLPMLNGKIVFVSKLNDKVLPARHLTVAKGFMPKDTSFSLGEIGFSSVSVHSSHADPIVVDLNTFPGVSYEGGEQKLHISYGYGAEMNPDLSSLEVRLNGVSLRSYPLDKAEGEEHHEDVIAIADHILQDHNKLEFYFHMYPHGIGKCLPLLDAHLWGTLYETSKLELPRKYSMLEPDLALFQNQGYPLLQGSTQNLAFVIPSNCNSAGLLGLAQLSCLFGKWSGVNSLPCLVYLDSSVPSETIKHLNLIVLRPGQSNKFEEQLDDKLTLHKVGSSQLSLTAKDIGDITVTELSQAGFLEEIPSPMAQGATMLVVYGSTVNAFNQATKVLVDPLLNNHLSGSLVATSPQDLIKGVQSTVVAANNDPFVLKFEGLVPLSFISLLLPIISSIVGWLKMIG